VKELGQGKVTLVLGPISRRRRRRRSASSASSSPPRGSSRTSTRPMAPSSLAKKVPENDPLRRRLLPRAGSEVRRAADAERSELLAIPTRPRKLAGVHARDHSAPKFCDALTKNKDKTLIDPFTTISASRRRRRQCLTTRHKRRLAKDQRPAQGGRGGARREGAHLKAYSSGRAGVIEQQVVGPPTRRGEKWTARTRSSTSASLRRELRRALLTALFHVSSRAHNQGVETSGRRSSTR